MKKALNMALFLSFMITIMVPVTGIHVHKLAATAFLLLSCFCLLYTSRDRDADLAEQLANEHILHVMQNLKRQGYEQNETAGGV